MFNFSFFLMSCENQEYIRKMTQKSSEVLHYCESEGWMKNLADQQHQELLYVDHPRAEKNL